MRDTPTGDQRGLAGLRMTADQFLALGETIEKLTLIDGVVTVLPRPSFLHQEVSCAILLQVSQWRKANPGARSDALQVLEGVGTLNSMLDHTGDCAVESEDVTAVLELME